MNNYKKIILNNGIPLYLYNDKSLKQVFVNYIVKYGSSGKWYNFNLDGKQHHILPGYAHYLEHLLGEHSKHGNIYTNFSDRCYDANAYTSSNHTSYYFYGVDDIKKSIRELIEAIDCPVFTKDDVDHSRHAIEEEASMRCDCHDITAASLVEKNLYSSFDVYDDTLCCIGNRNTTKGINIDDLYHAYNAFYSDDNKVLVIAGNVNEEELVNYLNEIYSQIPAHKNSVILPKYDMNPIRRKEEVIYRDVKTNINSLGIKVKKPEFISNMDFEFCMDFLIEYLFGKNSEFYSLLKKKSLIDILQYYYLLWNEEYISFIHTCVTADKDNYYNALFEKINNLNVTKEDFELIRKRLISEEVRGLDDRYKIPSEFGYRMQYTDNLSLIDYYRNVNYDKLIDILSKLNFDNYTKGSVLKLSEK